MSLNRYVSPADILACLDLPMPTGLPVLTSCPGCKHFRLIVAEDGVLGGGWYACHGCDFAGDAGELAALAWSVSPDEAWRRLSATGIVEAGQGGGEAIIRHSLEHIGPRKATLAFWQSCRMPPTTHDVADLEGPLRRFGLMNSARSTTGWLDGIGRFVGISDRAAVESALGKNRKIFPGQGWGRVLVIPFWDYPGRIRSFLFVGRDGDEAAGDWAFRRLGSGPATSEAGDKEAGLAMLGALSAPAHSKGILLSPDVAMAVRFQARQLDAGKNPLPLAAFWDGKGVATGVSFGGIRRISPLVIWGSGPVAVRHAARLKVSISPGLDEQAIARRPPKITANAIFDAAVRWDTAVEMACSKLPAAEAEELIWEAGIKADDLRRVADAAPKAVAGRLAGIVAVQGSKKTVAIAGKVVVEDRDRWTVARPGQPDELLSDAIIRVDRVMKAADGLTYRGRVLFAGREIPFRVGADFEKDPFAFARSLAIENGVGVPIAAPGWGRYGLSLAMQMHPPEAGRSYARCGWDRERNAFVFPGFFLEAGGRITEHDDLDVSGPLPCVGLESLDEDPTELDLAMLTATGHGRGLGMLLGIAAHFVANALDSRLGRPLRSLALTGPPSRTLGLAGAEACGAPRIASGPWDHAWPAIADHNLKLPCTVSALSEFGAAAAAVAGWTVIRGERIGGTVPAGAMCRLVFGQLRRLSKAHYPAFEGDAASFALRDQEEWLNELGFKFMMLGSRFSRTPELGDALAVLAGFVPEHVDASTPGRVTLYPTRINRDLQRRHGLILDLSEVRERLIAEDALLEDSDKKWTFAESWWRPRATRVPGTRPGAMRH